MRRLIPAGITLFGLAVAALYGQQPGTDAPPFTDAVRAGERLPRTPAAIKQRADMLRDSLAKPFVGITTNGTPRQGLFSIRSAGVATEPIRLAAEALLRSFRFEPRQRAMFELEDAQWRRWDNVPSPPAPPKLGVNMAEMTATQRDLAFALLQVSLSAKGFKTSQDIMKLNGTMSEGTQSDRFGRWLYSIAIMGTPSNAEPWGWQFNGRNMPSSQGKIRVEEVSAHLDDTHFAWIGKATPGSTCYYRIQSPVILIEFDHQGSVRVPAGVSIRDHIHTIVRTPNGGDYGKDLLRQHYLTHPHPTPQ